MHATRTKGVIAGSTLDSRMKGIIAELTLDSRIKGVIAELTRMPLGRREL